MSDRDDGDRPSRAELERALRRVNLEVAELRGQLQELYAYALAVGSQVAGATDVDADDIGSEASEILDRLELAEEESPGLRIDIGGGFEDKYALPELDIPCEELLPICKARCCTLRFSLSPQDLDEGVARWDYGAPYQNRQRADGYCVHNQPGSFGCSIYGERPAPCRKFDCRGDKRIWRDYDQRIPATDRDRDTDLEMTPDTPTPLSELREAIALRRAALLAERLALREDDD